VSLLWFMIYNVGLYVIIGRAILSNDETLRTDSKVKKRKFIGGILEQQEADKQEIF